MEAMKLPSYLCKIPNEVILEFICLLAVEDILSVRMTCQKLYALTRLRSVWHAALHRHVISKGLSVPSPYQISGERYLAASSFDIESRTVHAVRLHKTFTSVDPEARATHVKIQSFVGVLDDNYYLHSLIFEVAFLNTASGHHYLIAVLGLYRLGCWEISPDGGGVHRVALWSSRRPIRRMMVNELSEWLEDDSAQGLLAVAYEHEPGTLKVTILGLDRFHGCFLNMGTIEVGVASWLHFFRGSLFGLSEQPQVVHWQDGSFFQLLREPVSHVVTGINGNTTVDMRLLDDNSLLLITTTTIELFLMPANQAPFSLVTLCCVGRFNIPRQVIPLATAVIGYNLQADNIRIPTRKPPRRKPLSIVMRAVDDSSHVIHHFVFDIETLPPDGSPPAIPLRFPPTLVRTIPTLPCCENLHLSPSGKGYWIETRTVGPNTHSYPARGVVPLYLSPLSTTQVAPDLPEDWHVDLQVGTKTLYERPCGYKDLGERRQRLSSVAFDDSMGRLAVGHTDGGIVILSYA